MDFPLRQRQQVLHKLLVMPGSVGQHFCSGSPLICCSIKWGSFSSSTGTCCCKVQPDGSTALFLWLTQLVCWSTATGAVLNGAKAVMHVLAVGELSLPCPHAA